MRGLGRGGDLRAGLGFVHGSSRVSTCAFFLHVHRACVRSTRRVEVAGARGVASGVRGDVFRSAGRVRPLGPGVGSPRRCWSMSRYADNEVFGLRPARGDACERKSGVPLHSSDEPPKPETDDKRAGPRPSLRDSARGSV
eukprot:2226133-Prymnesium_polylepis.1